MKLKIGVPSDPAIPFLGLHPAKTHIYASGDMYENDIIQQQQNEWINCYMFIQWNTTQQQKWVNYTIP